MQNVSFDINVHALAAMRAAGEAHTVLDIREPAEVATCALEGNVAIPMQHVPAQLDQLPREHPLVVLCHHGTRSAMVTNFLRENGFDNAVNLAGGIDAWAVMVEPEMPRY